MTGVDETLATSFLTTLKGEIDRAEEEFIDYPIGWLKKNFCSPDSLFGSWNK